MSLLSNTIASEEHGGSFYNGVATQSVRIKRASSQYLNRSIGSARDRQKLTFAFWVKLTGAAGSNGSTTGIIIAQGDAGAGASQSGAYVSFNSGHFRVVEAVSNTLIWEHKLTADFRDYSAWYHFVVALDTTQATNTNRVKIYLNGVLQTDYSTRTYPDQDASQRFGMSGTDVIGVGIDAGSIWSATHYDGYIADFHYVDGTQLDASYFGETKNGVWIPKEYTGSHGTAGYNLKFDQVGVGTASTSTIGADTSGNTNHFTSSGIVASDCAMPDSPENNFCTLNPTRGAYGNTNPNGTLAEGNLKFSAPNQTYFYNSAGTIFPTSGKWYWEVFIVSNNNNAGILGIVTSGGDTKEFPGWDTEGLGYGWASSNGNKIHNNTSSSYVNETALANDIAGIALDLDNGTLTFYHNNASQGQAFSSIDSSKGWSFGSGTGYLTTFVANFGQDSSFAGNKTAQGNTDGNGIGDFYYAPPSGYKALCTANLPEPTIGANSLTQADDHFNTVLWTGDNNARSIDDVGFQPDWLWTKSRSNAESHRLHDSSRGDNGTVMYELNSDATEVEGTDTLVTGFDAEGFNIAAGGNTPNVSGRTYVAWNWKANGGTTSSNTDGSITSTVQANTDAGFSIVTYTGTGASNATIGHGLGAIPKMLIVKNRSEAYNWKVYHAENTSAPATDYLVLDTTDATADSATHWNDTAPTSSVFSIGSSNALIKNTNTFVAYCFAEVEGYSKFGSYTGNGNADGTFVYTGFRPAWIMFKTTTIVSHWTIVDNARSTYNVVDDSLYADTSAAELTTITDVDFLSNGFKWRGVLANETNVSGQVYIYMAFAEESMKYSNGR